MSEIPDSPQTRTETYLAGALGQPVLLPEPVTRLEQYLKAIAESGGGGGGLMPVIIYAESHTTVSGYVVPVLTDAQLTAAYNGVMAGKVVVIVDDMDTIAIQAYDASNIDGTAIRVLFTDKLILNYKEGGEIVATALAGGSGATTWGAITGTLANQTDLQTALNGKAANVDFEGTDGTTAGTAGLVPAPSTTDAGKFLKADGTWAEAGESGDGVKVLTEDDYNWPTSGTKTSVAAWLLEPGWYRAANSSVSVRAWSDRRLEGEGLILVTAKAPGESTRLVVYFSSNTAYSPVCFMSLFAVYDAGSATEYFLSMPVNNLTNTDPGLTLSAAQGKALKDLIDALDGRVRALEGNA